MKFATAASLLLVSLPALAEPATQPLTLERVYASPALSGPRPRVLKLSPDGRLATLLKSRASDKDRFDLWAVDTATGQSRMLVDSEKLSSGAALSEAERMNRERKRIADVKGITDYAWAPDARRLLVPVEGDLWVAGLDGNVSRLTQTPETETDAQLSPKGGFASFVRDGHLFVQALAGGAAREVAGEATPKVSWGVAEFIAQEELDRFDGHWWAPDDSRIAVARVDEGPVQEVTRAAIGADGTRLFTQAYPAAGTANADVSLWLVNPDGSGKVLADLGYNKGEFYIARVAWAVDGKTLYVQRLARDQQRLDILAVDPATGASRVLASETAKTWVNVHNSFRPLKDGSILWASERDGYRHLYRLVGGTAQQLTNGRWVMDELVGIDEKRGRLWFTGFADSTLEKHVYALDFRKAGARPVRLTAPGGWHEAVMDDAGQRLIVTSATPSQPAQVWLGDSHGKRLAWIEENRLDGSHPYAPYLAAHVQPQFGTLTAADGQAMDWRLLKPAGPGPFPVLLQVYGGPHAHNVSAKFTAPIEQYLVSKGWAVFQLDNRGSNNRGMAFEAPIYRAMGGVEVQDQLQALQWIKSQPWAGKVAVNGWSYGGYMVVKLLEAAPGAFAAGIAGAPVTRWELYDTAYTERYLGNPVTEPGVYAKSGALGDAGKIADPLLLIHGMADDNVVFENSTALMTALQRARKPFDLMVYPGATHATPGLEVHTWITRLKFLGRTVAPTGY
ncbi:DPP IV N-terminal domain-containing protein [Sandarakinorhabdus sp. AAP62]|uniref:S9 family peptidase n=1 Tax=Sandarakinorhabdus sp. AAP62 TaxID=1248916 RepID=UPI0002E2582E|nr:DPP IV N-terminal domain-containing protein [Sandarakinorhabdus sp. AAP62]